MKWDNFSSCKIINALACLTATSLGMMNAKLFLELGYRAEICIKEVKITGNLAKPTVIE